MKFPCDNCVLCCKHIELIKELEKFDSGNGSCKYLTEDNICSIYDQRPDACDVKKMYESIYKKKINEKEYIELTRGECKQIKQGLEAYEAYIDRISLPTKPVKLTNEEIEQLKKDGRI